MMMMMRFAVLGFAFLLLGCGGGVLREADGHALYRMGHYEEALRIWERAARGGDAGSAFRLGAEYQDAKVVDRDMGKAAAYFEQAARGGDARAQMDLGTLYDKGRVLGQDFGEAARWYLAAAEGGLPEAQHNIAVMYEEGVGVEMDLVRAALFYRLAIMNDFGHFSGPALEELEKRMSWDEILEARRLAKAFRPG